MSRKEKLLDLARTSPQRLSFDEFESLMSLCDWILKRQRGSHRIWYSPTKFRLSVQPTKNKEAKVYQGEQFLRQYDRENTTP
jgi:predicted RNA binding protein YcfA (HicA-like mRNA interferase family)